MASLRTQVLNGVNLQNMNGGSDMTLTVLGCGTLGIAILSGIFSSLNDLDPLKRRIPSSSGTSTPAEPPTRTPTKFIACVRRHNSVKKIKETLSSYSNPLTILQNDNVKGVERADVVILGCKPQGVKDVLQQEGMKEALDGKLLISICAGVTVDQILKILYADKQSGTPPFVPPCRVVRVMPNTAAINRESMTVIATSDPPLPPQWDQLVDWIFRQIGEVTRLPPTMMDVSTALCGSGPAFYALILEAMAEGAVMMGMPRAEAQFMAAQTMRGTAGMVLGRNGEKGEHPALVREKVSTPGGCTIGGLHIMEQGTVRGTVARAIKEATLVAGGLGKKKEAGDS